MVVLVSGAWEADVPVYTQKSILEAEQECSAQVTQDLLVKGQATPTLGLSTRRPTGGKHWWYTTYYWIYGHGSGRMSDCQKDLRKSLLIKYSGMPKQTHTTMNSLPKMPTVPIPKTT